MGNIFANVLFDMWRNFLLSSNNSKFFCVANFARLIHQNIYFNLERPICHDRESKKKEIIHDSIAKKKVSKRVIKNLFNNVWIYLHMKITKDSSVFYGENEQIAGILEWWHNRLRINFSIGEVAHQSVLTLARLSSLLYMFAEMFLLVRRPVNVGCGTCQNTSSPSSKKECIK